VNIRLLVAPFLVLTSLSASAADIAREVVTSSDRSDGYAEFSFMLGTGREPLIGFNGKNSIEESDDQINFLNLGLDARFRYKDVFIELVEDSFSNITLGYIVSTSNSGSLELIGTNVFDIVERDEIPGLESINDRDGDFNLGFRSSTYRGDSVFQFELMADVSNAHEGVIGAVHVGRQKQIRNWNLHGLLGARLFSDKVADYYMGVSPDEATADIPEYRAKAGVLPSIQVGATLPLSEKWIFETQVQYTHLPDSISDSPLAQGDAIYAAQVGVSYVFGGR
jgi:outer membrane scaffolding protein for murein synthesis (MipA/OmpV family)